MYFVNLPLYTYIVGDGDEVNLLPSWQGARPLLETGSHSLAKSGSNYTFKWMLGTKDQMKCFFYPSDPVDGFIPIGWTLSLFSKVSNISGQRGAFLRSYFVKKKCKMACCLEMSRTSNFTKMISREIDMAAD